MKQSLHNSSQVGYEIAKILKGEVWNIILMSIMSRKSNIKIYDTCIKYSKLNKYMYNVHVYIMYII